MVQVVGNQPHDKEPAWKHASVWIPDMKKANQDLLRILEKADAGEELTDDEFALLSNIVYFKHHAPQEVRDIEHVDYPFRFRCRISHDGRGNAWDIKCRDADGLFSSCARWIELPTLDYYKALVSINARVGNANDLVMVISGDDAVEAVKVLSKLFNVNMEKPYQFLPTNKKVQCFDYTFNYHPPDSEFPKTFKTHAMLCTDAEGHEGYIAITPKHIYTSEFPHEVVSNENAIRWIHHFFDLF